MTGQGILDRVVPGCEEPSNVPLLDRWRLTAAEALVLRGRTKGPNHSLKLAIAELVARQCLELQWRRCGLLPLKEPTVDITLPVVLPPLMLTPILDPALQLVRQAPGTRLRGPRAYTTLVNDLGGAAYLRYGKVGFTGGVIMPALVRKGLVWRIVVSTGEERVPTALGGLFLEELALECARINADIRAALQGDQDAWVRVLNGGIVTLLFEDRCADLARLSRQFASPYPNDWTLYGYGRQQSDVSHVRFDFAALDFGWSTGIGSRLDQIDRIFSGGAGQGGGGVTGGEQGGGHDSDGGGGDCD